MLYIGNIYVLNQCFYILNKMINYIYKILSEFITDKLKGIFNMFKTSITMNSNDGCQRLKIGWTFIIYVNMLF
jgi:hypothetical protein